MLARISPCGGARPAVWIPGARSLLPVGGSLLQPFQFLLDPYAKAIDGQVRWDEAVFGYTFDKGPDSRSDRDSAPFLPKSVVHQPHFDWSGDRRLQLSWREMIIYEAHVKGLTARHPSVPEELRGTYAGLAHPAVVGHLKALGVTAVELMPVHFFIHDKHLVDQGLKNYWGYNSIGYFAP